MPLWSGWRKLIDAWSSTSSVGLWYPKRASFIQNFILRPTNKSGKYKPGFSLSQTDRFSTLVIVSSRIWSTTSPLVNSLPVRVFSRVSLKLSCPLREFLGVLNLLLGIILVYLLYVLSSFCLTSSWSAFSLGYNISFKSPYLKLDYYTYSKHDLNIYLSSLYSTKFASGQSLYSEYLLALELIS